MSDIENEQLSRQMFPRYWAIKELSRWQSERGTIPEAGPIADALNEAIHAEFGTRFYARVRPGPETSADAAVTEEGPLVNIRILDNNFEGAEVVCRAAGAVEYAMEALRKYESLLR